MIKLDEQEMEEAIDRAIEKFWGDYALLYDMPLYGRNNTYMPDHEYVAPSYYSKSILQSLCVRLIAELCEAEVEKVKGEAGEYTWDENCIEDTNDWEDARR